MPRRRTIVVVGAAVVAALVGCATARAAAPGGGPAWQAGTPASGSSYHVRVGEHLRLRLSAASDDPLATVRVSVSGLSSSGRTRAVAGNPGRLLVDWAPTETDVGYYVLAFAASDDVVTAGSAPPLIVLVRVLPPHTRRLRLAGPAPWAAVVRPSLVYAQPKLTAPVVSRLSTSTSDALQNIVSLVSGVRRGSQTWLCVRLAVLPNGSTGWVLRSALGPFHRVRTHLVVTRARFTAVLYRSGRAIFRADVGVGRPLWPTPAGQFYVRERLTDFGNPFYGPLAFGTNARSAVLTDWPGGGFIGIHGTDAPELLPGAVSHGCIRMRNDDLLRLARLLPLGTTLTVR